MEGILKNLPVYEAYRMLRDFCASRNAGISVESINTPLRTLEVRIRINDEMFRDLIEILTLAIDLELVENYSIYYPSGIIFIEWR